MDSGLGSDEERRGRTKEQKQRHNQQLLSGCFIDAASLSDEPELVTDQRRSDERRQGALLFQTSIPQFSMLQMPVQQLSASCTSIPTSTCYSDDNTTPYNSIVHLDQDNGSQKPSLGFYVDLSDVGEPEAEPEIPTSSSVKKNIFSMVIDFEAPKKDKPSCLSSSMRNGKKAKSNSAEVPLKAAALNCGEVSGKCKSTEINSVEVGDDGQSASQYSSLILFDEATGDSCLEQRQQFNGCDVEDEHTGCEHEEVCRKPEVKENIKFATVEETELEPKQFVRLSDLEHQTPRSDLIMAPRMSRSIPESSWVESPLFMSHSIGYRSVPRPLEPENCDSSDGSSNTDNSTSQPRRSVARLGTDLLRMFLEEIGPDVVVEVGARRIRAHRCILVSRCQYFAGSLSGRPTETISINGFSYDAVHFAMCHIYSGAAHVPDSIGLAELASLADMLCLEGLKEVVAHALKSRHCHNFHRPCSGCCIGVVEVLHLSAAYGLDELYQKCLKWITQHFVRVWPTKAFCGLTKELKEKCLQQHVIHLSAEGVLDTILGCNRLLATVPSLRWADSVVQLGLKLTDACQLYMRQHFAAVLSTPAFLALNGDQAWNISRLEDTIIDLVPGLSIEQACRSYMWCRNNLEKSWSLGFLELLKKLDSKLEQSLVSRAERVAKSNSWQKLDPKSRARIKELSCLPLDEPCKSRPTRMPVSKTTTNSPRLKPQQNRNTPSSTESSRNTSPSMKPGVIDGSPSLRRSLLLAARAPQVPPSPTVQRRSTLTKPTASSAAKSAPSRNLKTTPAKTTSVKPAAAPKGGRETDRSSVSSARSTISIRTTTISRDSSKSNVTRMTNSTNRVSTPSSSRRVFNVKETPVPAKSKPATVQRSSTFLKEKPTVLGKTHADAPLVQS